MLLNLMSSHGWFTSLLTSTLSIATDPSSRTGSHGLTIGNFNTLNQILHEQRYSTFIHKRIILL